VQGEETPSESLSLGDDEEEEDEEKEEGEVISSPHASSPKVLPPPSDLFSQQVGIPASACWAKHPRTYAGGMSSPRGTVWPHAGIFCPVGNTHLYLLVHA
jgi:hypothetical protein